MEAAGFLFIFCKRLYFVLVVHGIKFGINYPSLLNPEQEVGFFFFFFLVCCFFSSLFFICAPKLDHVKCVCVTYVLAFRQ